MPIYEYRCPRCDREFQKLVYGQPAVSCPSCQSPDVRRVPSLFGIGTSAGPAASAPAAGCCGPGGCGCR